MPHENRFEDEVVVITGGAGGIGFATAELAVAEGAKIAINDIRADVVEEAVAKLRAAGGDAIGVVGDVTDIEQVRANVAEIKDHFGKIDVLVNNAAVNTYQDTTEMSAETWNREISVCLTGQFFWAQSVANAAMIPARRGAIVNVGSGASLAGIPRCAAYVAAKHGVVGLTKALAVDWGQYNIRTNCVCPGLTFTELAKAAARQNPEGMRERETRIPTGRGAQPIDVARAILFLGSFEGDAINGAALALDGGTTALSSGFSAPRLA